MTKQTPDTVDGHEYSRFHPGQVEASSKKKHWDGLIYTQYNHPKTFSGSPRPATNDHIIAIGNNGAVKGENSVNSDKWNKYEWREQEIFLGPAFANDRDARWEAMSGQEALLVSYIHLSPEILRKEILYAGIANPDTIELRGQLGFQDPFIYQLGERLHYELANDNPFGNLYIESAANMLAAHLLRFYCTTDYDLSVSRACSRNYIAIKRVKDYIHEHIADDISLQVMAAIAKMSCFHFARSFKSIEGIAPHQFIVSVRMKNARKLLESTDFSVTHIANELGYTPAHFGQVFKRTVGITPLAYRQCMR